VISEDGTRVLEIHERAALLGLDLVEWYALVEQDWRILASEALVYGGAGRLRSWLDRGRPTADPTSLAFNGIAPAIETIAHEVLAAMPAPHVEHVVTRTSLFVLSGERGLCHCLPDLRTPIDDQPHVISINAAHAEDVAGLLAHEWSHSWHATMAPVAPQEPKIERRRAAHERAFRAQQLEAHGGPEFAGLVDDLLELRIRSERAADTLASLWLNRRYNSLGPHRDAHTRAVFEGEAAAGALLPGVAEDVAGDVAELASEAACPDKEG
jgi:hypothetical protein